MTQTKSTVVCTAVEDDLAEWIDSKCETQWGTLSRSDVVRTVLRAAMDNDT